MNREIPVQVLRKHPFVKGLKEHEIEQLGTLNLPLRDRQIVLALIDALNELSPVGLAIAGTMRTENLGIGSGGFGVVYRAVQPVVEREVAVKIILPVATASGVDTITRAAQPALQARGEHRMRLARIGADHHDHVGQRDRLEGLRAGRGAVGLPEAVAGGRVADARAGVDVVVAERRAHHLLHQERLLVGAARRGDAADREADGERRDANAEVLPCVCLSRDGGSAAICARGAMVAVEIYSRSLCRWSPMTPSPSRLGSPAAESRLPSEPPPAWTQENGARPRSRPHACRAANAASSTGTHSLGGRLKLPVISSRRPSRVFV